MMPKKLGVLVILAIFGLFRYFHGRKPSICGSKSTRRGNGQKVIAYSFFGDQEVYLQGLYKNVEKVPLIYGPNWIIRVYLNNMSQKAELSKLEQLAHVDFCLVSNLPRIFGIPVKGKLVNNCFSLFKKTLNYSDMLPTLWRFLPLIDPLVEEFHSRDLDSAPSLREFAAVQEFAQDPSAQFHIMRDHKLHNAPITAGMWGAKPGKNPELAGFVMKQMVDSSVNKKLIESHGKYADQAILARHLYPYINGKALVHDSYNCIWMRLNKTKGFPTQREEKEEFNFVGSNAQAPMLEICPPPCRGHPDWIYC